MYKIYNLINLIAIIPALILLFRFTRQKKQNQLILLISIYFVGIIYSFLVFLLFYYNTAKGFITATQIDKETSFFEIGRYMEGVINEFLIFPSIYVLLFLLTWIYFLVIKNRINFKE
jgi:hypothetical protein